jgi:hypothetical protein
MSHRSLGTRGIGWSPGLSSFSRKPQRQMQFLASGVGMSYPSGRKASAFEAGDMAASIPEHSLQPLYRGSNSIIFEFQPELCCCQDRYIGL